MLYFIIGIFIGIILIVNSINNVKNKKSNLDNIIFLICGIFLLIISIVGFFVPTDWELTIYVGLLVFAFIPILIYIIKKEPNKNKKNGK